MRVETDMQCTRSKTHQWSIQRSDLCSRPCPAACYGRLCHRPTSRTEPTTGRSILCNRHVSKITWSIGFLEVGVCGSKSILLATNSIGTDAMSPPSRPSLIKSPPASAAPRLTPHRVVALRRTALPGAAFLLSDGGRCPVAPVEEQLSFLAFGT